MTGNILSPHSCEQGQLVSKPLCFCVFVGRWSQDLSVPTGGWFGEASSLSGSINWHLLSIHVLWVTISNKKFHRWATQESGWWGHLANVHLSFWRLWLWSEASHPRQSAVWNAMILRRNGGTRLLSFPPGDAEQVSSTTSSYLEQPLYCLFLHNMELPASPVSSSICVAPPPFLSSPLYLTFKFLALPSELSIYVLWDFKQVQIFAWIK